IYILAYMYLAFKIFILLSKKIKFLSGQTAEGLRVYDILFSKIGNLINFVQQNFGFFAKISFNSFIKTNAIIEEIFCAAFIEHGDLLVQLLPFFPEQIRHVWIINILNFQVES